MASAARFAPSTACTTVFEPCTTFLAANPPRSGSHAVFIHQKQSAFRTFKSYSGTNQFLSGILTDGNNHRIRLYQFCFICVSDHFIILVENCGAENRSLFCNRFNCFSKYKFRSSRRAYETSLELAAICFPETVV